MTLPANIVLHDSVSIRAALADALADVVAYEEAMATLAEYAAAFPPVPAARTVLPQGDAQADAFARAFDGGKITWIDDMPVFTG